MEIKYLQEFALLADIGSFLETSERLFISQSSLTRHIQTLEEELGTQVFDRTTRTVSLNRFGQLLLPYARKINRLKYEYTTAIINELQSVHSTVRIGSIPVMQPYGIYDAIVQFQKENPSFSLEIIEEDSVQLIKMLNAGLCDLAFLRETNGKDTELVRQPFASDELVALMPDTHYLASRDSIQLSDLAQEPLLIRSRDSFLYYLCVNEFRNLGTEPRIAFTGKTNENIISFVEMGMGISPFMRKGAMQLMRPGIAMVKIEPTIRSLISIAYSKDIPLTDSAEHFLNFIKSLPRGGGSK